MKEFLLERTPGTYFCFFLICCIKSRADRQQLLIAETLKTLKTRLFSSRFCRNAAANVPFLNISSGLSLFFCNVWKLKPFPSLCSIDPFTQSYNIYILYLLFSEMYIQMMYYGSKYDVNNQSRCSEHETKMC